MSPLPEKEYCQELSQFLKIIETSGLNPSYFELLIAFAYWLFDKRGMEYAVIEVGLGGLLDGTNVIKSTNKVCIITDIGLDHTKILGDTITKIAYQKAGIIMYNNSVFTYLQDEKVMMVIKNRCLAENAGLRVIQSEQQTNSDLKSLPLFQQRNIYLSIQAVNHILDRDYSKFLTPTEILQASSIYIPGRMEIVKYKSKTIILDGSHNEQKIGALVESMKQLYGAESVALLVSFGENKQTSVLNCIKLLRTISSTIILTAFDIGQDEVRNSIKPAELAILAQEVGFNTILVEPEPKKALSLLLENTTDIGLVTGSFYLLNHVREVVL